MTWEDLKDLGRQLRTIAVNALDAGPYSASRVLIDIGIKGHCYELTNTHPVVVQKRSIRIDCSLDESDDGGVTRTIVRDDDQDSFDGFADQLMCGDIIGENKGFDLNWLNESDECQ